MMMNDTQLARLDKTLYGCVQQGDADSRLVSCLIQVWLYVMLSIRGMQSNDTIYKGIVLVYQ